MIHVYLYPPFAGMAGAKEVDLPWSAGLTVGGALELLATTCPGLTGHLRPADLLCLVNGRMAAIDCSVGENAQLSLLLLAAGG